MLENYNLKARMCLLLQNKELRTMFKTLHNTTLGIKQSVIT